MLRHEQVIDIPNPDNVRLRQTKTKKIIVTLTAQNSCMKQDLDTETMDLNKKDQETS